MLITEFKSRGDEIHVLPLTFSEYVNGFNTSEHALWNEYTVFGEVLEGMDIVDQIQRVATDGNDRPEEDIIIKKVTILE